MFESLLREINELYPQRAFLTVEEVAKLLNCSERVVHNWTRRSEIKKRPPRLMVGKTLRFPKSDFARWLSSELAAGGESQ